MTINPCDKRGFTLIEVLVTLLILAFGMLASVIGIMKAVDYSLMDEMRNEAMKIAQEQQEVVRNMNYTAIPQLPATQLKGVPVYRQLRKQQQVAYTLFCTLPAPPAAAAGMGGRLVDFTVKWTFKGTTYSYDLQTIVRQSR